MKKNKTSNLVKNSRGQGVMEYIIISSLIGIACLVAVQKFGGTVKDRIDWMDKKVSKRISHSLFR
jgi:Flp pilus assembly pilin Flp